jgi:hypothetical protein
MDKITKLELDNYLADEPKDTLATMLDELIKKGSYN